MNESWGMGPKRQVGGIYTKLYVLLTLGLLAMVTAKVGPVYLNESYVQTAFKRVAEAPTTPTLSKKKVLDKIQENFIIDSVKHVKRNHMKVKGSGEGRKISYEYDVYIPMFWNIQIYLPFSNEYKMG